MSQAERQVEAGKVIPANVEELKTTQVRRQHQIGQLILGHEQCGQISHPKGQGQAGQVRIFGKTQSRQMTKTRRQSDTADRILAHVEIGQPGQLRGQVEVGELVGSQVKKTQAGQVRGEIEPGQLIEIEVELDQTPQISRQGQVR